MQRRVDKEAVGEKRTGGLVRIETVHIETRVMAEKMEDLDTRASPWYHVMVERNTTILIRLFSYLYGERIAQLYNTLLTKIPFLRK